MSERQVVLITTHYPPLVGGAATYFSHLGRALAALDYRVHVLTTRVDGQPTHETIHGVEISRVVPNLRPVPGIVRRWAQALVVVFELKMLWWRRQLGVIHVHASKSVTVGAAGFSAIYHVPIVFDVQDFLSRPRVLMTGWRRRYVATGQPITDHLCRLGVQPEQIITIPSIPPDDARRPLAKRENKEPTVLFVGEFHREIKGEDVLLAAFNELHRRQPTVTLVMIGDGPDRHLDEQYITQQNLSAPIKIRGILPPPWVQEEMNAADVLVVSSHTEGMPRVILEAFARGLPVVATCVGGIPEVVHDGKNGLLVDPNDPPGLAAAIEKVCRDAALRHRLGQAGRAWIDSLPRWSDLAKQIATVYPIKR